MEYFLGIDGGGTKTAYLLMGEDGQSYAQLHTKGCSYKEYGTGCVAAQLKEGLDYCLKEAGIQRTDLAGAALGLPCYGESERTDKEMEEKIRHEFSPAPVYITNDVEAGWAGSLGLKPGINIVAGTGSIAFGKNSRGTAARAGGWSTFFGDEGSCYWLGRRTMELFSKEADNRAPKGPLYDIIMEEFGLESEMEFVDRMEQEYMPVRSKTAGMQRLLLKAADLGDAGAAALYKEAAEELGSMIAAVAQKIRIPGERFGISYSGGLFHAKKYVMPALEERILRCGGYLTEPEFTPVQGAVLLAAQMFSEGKPGLLRESMKGQAQSQEQTAL